MKHLAFAVSVLALGFAAATPARADYAVVQFKDGHCRIWWDSSSNPWGSGWRKIAMAPDWSGADAALHDALNSNVCR